MEKEDLDWIFKFDENPKSEESDNLITIKESTSTTDDEDVEDVDLKLDEDDEEAPFEEEVEVSEEDSTFTPFVEEMYERGILDFDENTEYDDTEDGLADIVNYTIDKRYNEKLTKLPSELQDAIRIAEEGGDWTEIVNTVSEVNYADADLEDEDTQYLLVEEYLSSQGLDEDEIKETLETYQETSMLAKQAKIAQKFLVKRREDNIQKAAEQEKQAIENRKKKQQEMQSEIKNKILTVDEIAGFELSKKERQDLIDYIFTPVNKQGQTQLQLDASGDDLNPIKQAYMMMKKFNFSHIEKKAKTQTTKDLKKALSAYTDKKLKNQKQESRMDDDDFYLPE